MTNYVQNQFTSLDMASLIGGPLKAAYEAQSMLAVSTANFINTQIPEGLPRMLDILSSSIAPNTGEKQR